LKHLVADPKVRASQPHPSLHPACLQLLGNSQINPAIDNTAGLPSCSPHQWTACRPFPMPEKAPSSAASETPNPNSGAGGSKSSSISPPGKDSVPVPDSSDACRAAILHLAVTRGLTFLARAASPHNCHSYTWLPDIANHMQCLLFRAVTLLFFVSTRPSKHFFHSWHQTMQSGKDKGWKTERKRCSSESTMAQLSQRNDAR